MAPILIWFSQLTARSSPEDHAVDYLSAYAMGLHGTTVEDPVDLRRLSRCSNLVLPPLANLGQILPQPVLPRRKALARGLLESRTIQDGIRWPAHAIEELFGCHRKRFSGYPGESENLHGKLVPRAIAGADGVKRAVAVGMNECSDRHRRVFGVGRSCIFGR